MVEKVEFGKVYRNKKTGKIGVRFTGHDYGVIARNIEAAMIYQGSNENPEKDTSPPFEGTLFEDLELYTLKPEDLLTDEHVKSVCKPGSEETCRYLSVGSCGFECEKVSDDNSIAMRIDERVERGDMRAKGNNCGGRYSPLIFQSSEKNIIRTSSS